jgi:hypothetical protein
MDNAFLEFTNRLRGMLDSDPRHALSIVRLLDLKSFNNAFLYSSVLIDAGHILNDKSAVKDGVSILRELLESHDSVDLKYNLANGLASLVSNPPHNDEWLEHQELTRKKRYEIRQLYWDAASAPDVGPSIRTQALTNLANQFSNSYRLSEAHDTRLNALKVDAKNAVAAASASLELMWLHKMGIGSDTAYTEAVILAKVANENSDRLEELVGSQNAAIILEYAGSLPTASNRSLHKDPFINWVESERLTLSPTVELVEASLDQIDYLMLPPITGSVEKESPTYLEAVPPVFAMFNTLKSDFLIARHLAWKVLSKNSWPKTSSYADTLDYAVYGSEIAAITLAHRSALDLLDKVAIIANHYFKLGQNPKSLNFTNLWRYENKEIKEYLLRKKVENTIKSYAPALYGLVELSDDYRFKLGALNEQKDIRNASTHRFVVLHDMGVSWQNYKQAEIQHYELSTFTNETLKALRLARSAIQMLVLAIYQYEHKLSHATSGIKITQSVPQHDWIRRGNKTD